MRIGILTSGGDCPGLNAVIRGVVLKGTTAYGLDFVGIRDGWRGVVDGDFFPLSRHDVKGLSKVGGTILGTSRTNPYEGPRGGAENIARTLEDAGIDGILAIGGWIFTTWLRVKNGYPLENSWGKAVYPKTSDEAMERVKLISQENAQLRAELGSVKDRLAVVERIVTDESHRVAAEIEALRRPAN